MRASILYDAAPDNGHMKYATQSMHRPLPWRGIGIAIATVLFAASVAELLTRHSGHDATWRGLALSSLYVALCLTQRRLFGPRGAGPSRRTTL